MRIDLTSKTGTIGYAISHEWDTLMDSQNCSELVGKFEAMLAKYNINTIDSRRYLLHLRMSRTFPSALKLVSDIYLAAKNMSVIGSKYTKIRQLV